MKVLILVIALSALVACGGENRVPPGPTNNNNNNTPPDAGLQELDSGAHPDAAEIADAASPMDAEAPHDAGECSPGPISDQCCPNGANSTTDPDCPAVCGNGILEGGERCDTAIAGGTGACPTQPSCDDNLACTTDAVELDNNNPCSARCVSREITQAGRVDGCCPSGAMPGQDPDCAGCGDGVVAANETCDTAITMGPNRCPTAADCNDNDACTNDTLIGGGTCMAACSHAENTSRANGDGCCLEPNATLRSEDLDCPQVPLGYLCNVGSDCDSNRCEAFDVYNGAKGCTASCDPRSITVAADCPASSDASLWALCQSEANVTMIGAHNVCTYWTGSPNVAALLAPGPGLRVQIGTETRFFALPTYADNVARNWRITIAPNPGLDVVGRTVGPALIEEGVVCNAGGLGQQEVCAMNLTAAQSNQRYWFAVAAMSGSGQFDITLVQMP